MALSERLFNAQTQNILSQITVNLQRRTYSSATTDDAPAPYELFCSIPFWCFKLFSFFHRLLTVSNSTLSGVSTIVSMRALFDNYEADTMINENVTPQELREEDEFLDKILDTAVMKIAMTYLQQKGCKFWASKISLFLCIVFFFHIPQGIVRSDRANQKELLKTAWFTIYSRGGGRFGSSGFEHGKSLKFS